MIRELKTLVAVAREGTFAAAGHKIGLTQAAVSAQMQRLEEELGFPAVRSHRPGGAPEPEGPPDRRAGAGADQAVQQSRFAERRGQQRRPSSIRGDRFGAAFMAAGSPGKLLPASRGLPVRIVPGLSMQLLDLVDAGKIDLAVIIRPPFSLHSDLRGPRSTRAVPTDGAALCERTRLVRAAVDSPFIRYDRSRSVAGRWTGSCARRTCRCARSANSTNWKPSSIRGERGGHCASASDRQLQRWPAAVRAIDLGERTFHRDIGLVHRSGHSMSDAARRLAGMVCARYGSTGAG